MLPNIKLGIANSNNPLHLLFLSPLYLANLKLPKRFLEFIIFGIFIWFFSIILFLKTNIFEIKYLIGYLSGPAIYFYIGQDIEKYKKFFFFFIFIIILGLIVQMIVGKYTFPSLLPFLEIRNWAGGGRGYSSFYPEPSKAGQYFFICWAISFILLRGMNRLLLFIPLAIFLYLNKSATGAFFTLIFLSAFIFFKSKRMFLLLLIVFLLMIHFIMSLDAASRFTIVLKDYIILLSDPMFRQLILEDPLFFLDRLGGRRYLEVWGSYYLASDHFLGNGLGAVETEFFPEFLSQGFSNSTGWYEKEVVKEKLASGIKIIKPNSYASQLIYDFGWIGILGLFFLLRRQLFYIFKSKKEGLPEIKAAVVCGFFSLLFLSSLTLVISWVMFATIFINQRNE
jgi:hypothetical protein